MELRTLAREQASQEARSLRGFCSAGLLVTMVFWDMDMLVAIGGDGECWMGYWWGTAWNMV